MAFIRALRAGCAVLAITASAAWAEMPVLKAAVQTSGTVAWELDVIEHNGLDAANGFDLEVMDVAAGPAGQIAFQGGEADVIVSDWLWVARQRASGQDIVFIPYSKAVGAMMVPADSVPSISTRPPA